MISQNNIPERRLQAAFIDWCTAHLFFFPCAFVFFLLPKYQLIYLCFMFALIYSYLICKDICNGQSFGKYKYHLRVTTVNDLPASYLQLILRNFISLLLFPIMFLLLVTGMKNWIGDKIIGTKLVTDTSITGFKPRPTKKEFFIFLFILLLFFAFFLSIYVWINSFPKINGFLKLFYR